jgi:CRP-like cAMP-binding protein
MPEFFERIAERERIRLMNLAVDVPVKAGERLLRKGEPGGNIYRVKQGQLEVVDMSLQPPVVLKVIPTGGVVGELAFLDKSVRSADVVSAAGAICQRWEYRELERALKDPELAGAFYRALAGMTAERLRSTSTQIVGEIRANQRAADSESLGRELGRNFGMRLLALEPEYRRDRIHARPETLALLDRFGRELKNLVESVPENEGTLLGKDAALEFQPYLIRSHLGELTISDSTQGIAILTHIDSNRPQGDGPLGETIDEWLLSLPSVRALRERRAVLHQQLMGMIPADTPIRMLVVGVGSGALMGMLMQDLSKMRGEIRCIDDRLDAIARLRYEIQTRNRPHVILERADPWELVHGQLSPGREPASLVVVDGLLDALPSQLALELLEWARKQLAPQGRLLLTALAEAPDDVVLCQLLKLPLVRRSSSILTHLLEVAGFTDIQVEADQNTGIGLIGLASPLEFA